MSFDWTISAGNLISAAAVVGGLMLTADRVVHAFDKRLALLNKTLEAHAEALKKHDTAITTYENRVFDLVGTLQRLVGRFESLEHIWTSSKGRS